jgi:DNA-binding MarR family transcriptional regulator
VTTDRPLSDADYRTLAEFRHALRRFLSFSEEAARQAGLSPAQHQLLLAVRGHPGPGEPSIGDVAEVLLLRLHSAGELVGRAEGNGLVARRPDPTDARRVLLHLTPDGEHVLDALSRAHRDELRRFRAEAAALLDEL